MNQAVRPLAILLLLCGSSVVRAQEVRASISGIVTDPSGAPVSGAAITVTNTETSAAEDTRSNQGGAYFTPFLPPGAYRLTVENQGFKRYVHDSIVLQTLEHF